MKFNISLLVIVIPAFALADSIAFGDFELDGTTGLRYMWIEGKDPCQNARSGGNGFLLDCYNEGGLNLCNLNDNPCGHKFTLANGKSYKLEGCGGSGFALYYYNSGTFISRATYATWNSDCGDSSGNYQVHKTWQFQCNKPGC
ncbi:hypothetical protein BP6252_01157 [Coleophoma cylindrospora]|uniref:Cyanovirin-N domain-containing protein n=1 Tax=Coleophoma cylindrospora TaxID=1849047 RepID=A0A3D8SS51_9HELO|nr:hypothetical protein BP6252_01157 [Coleophoma cylindrospora]